MSDFVSSCLLPALWGFLACAGMSLMFNIHGFGVLVCSIGAALSSLIYFIGMDLLNSDIASAFLAAVLVGVYSECMARIRRCPVTGYLQVALLPLVPGAGIYTAMRYAVNGIPALFLSTLVHTLGVAAALSVGAMLSSSVFRVLYSLVYLRKHRIPKQS